MFTHSFTESSVVNKTGFLRARVGGQRGRKDKRRVHIPDSRSQKCRGGWACFCWVPPESERKPLHQTCNKGEQGRGQDLPTSRAMSLVRGGHVLRRAREVRRAQFGGGGLSAVLCAPAGSEPSSGICVVLQALKGEWSGM